LTQVAHSLLETGVDIDAPGSRFGGTALHGAAYRQHLPVVELLLDAGAVVTKADFNKITPLHTAATLDDVDIISALLNHGAKTDALDEAGETPLDWAKKSGQIEAESLMLGLPTHSEPEIYRKLDDVVWRESKATIPYFPNIYEQRSGLEASTIIKVEIGSTIFVL
jgi:ankyrin repeat protein